MAENLSLLNFTKLTWQQKLLWVSFVLYAFMVLFGVAHHEPWRDEAQSYLATRDNSISSLFAFLPSEGHPPLWYLLMMPFVKVGLPYMFQNWAAAILVIAGIYLIIFKSETPFIIKVLIPFNYYFLYEYAVFARNYCLVLFFAAAIISLYPKRFDKPILFALCVAGLFNTHMLIFSLAASITGVFLLDALQNKQINAKTLSAFGIMCISGLYLIPLIVLRDTADIFDKQVIDHTKEMLLTVSFGLLLNMNTDWGVLLFIVLMLPLLTRTKPALILAGGLTGILFILGYKMVGSVRHCGLLLTVIFVCYAIAENYANDPWNIKTKWKDLMKYGSWVLAGVVVLQLQYTIEHYTDDINRDYSDSKNAAAVIAQYNDPIIAGYPSAYTCTVLPYLDKKQKIFSAETKSFRTYYVNDSFYHTNLTDEYYVNTVKERFNTQLDKVILVCTHPIKQDVAQNLDLLYYTLSPTIFEYEMFCVYKFKKGVK